MHNILFQELINQEKSKQEIIDSYKFFVRDELRELQEARTVTHAIKEACDVYIVCEPLIQRGDAIQVATHLSIQETMIDLVNGFDVPFLKAIRKVEESNASKLILHNEIEEAEEYFINKGLITEIKYLGESLYAAYSAIDMPNYPKGKLLKPHCYAKIDESKEWWS